MESLKKLLSFIQADSWRSEQGAASLVTLLFGAFLLAVSIAVGLYVSLQVFIFEGNAETNALNFATSLVLGLTFLIGWIIALLSIRLFNNQLMPKIIWGLCWLCTGYAAFIYLKIIQNLHDGVDSSVYTKERFVYYVMAALVGVVATIIMQLLLERHNFQLLGVPLLVGSFLHLMIMLIHYVFNPPSLDFKSLIASPFLRHLADVGEKYPNEASGFSSKPHSWFYVRSDIIFFLIMLCAGIYFILNAPFLFRGLKRFIHMGFPIKE